MEAAAVESPSLTMIVTWLEVIGPMWTTGGPRMSPWTDAPLGSCRLQVLKLPITKSDSVAVGLCDERVSAMKLAKQSPSPSAERFTPSSRNSPAAGCVLPLLFLYDQGTEIGEPL